MRPNLRPVLAGLALAAAVVITARDPAVVTAQPKAAPVAVPPQAPTLNVAFPLGAQRGQAVELTLTGTNLADPTALWTSFPAKVTIPTDMNNGKDAAKLRVKLDVPADAPIGLHAIRLATKHGISNARHVLHRRVAADRRGDRQPHEEKAQPVPVPCVVVGQTDAEASDYFKVTVKPGQRLTFEVIGRRLGSPLDPVIMLYDGKTGREMAGHYSDDEPGPAERRRLTRTFPSGGDIAVEVRDTRHLRRGDFYYRLRIGEFPGAMAAFPLAVKRGAKAKVGFSGQHVESVPPVEVTMPGRPTAALSGRPEGAGGVSGWPVPVYASRHGRAGRAGAEQRAGQGQPAAGPERHHGPVPGQGRRRSLRVPGQEGDQVRDRRRRRMSCSRRPRCTWS